MLVAECEGIPIGFANFTQKDEDGDSELTAMYILPSHQQMGYGKQLIQSLFRYFQMHSNYLFMWMDVIRLDEPFMKNKALSLLDVFEEVFRRAPCGTAQYVFYIHPRAIAFTKKRFPPIGGKRFFHYYKGLIVPSYLSSTNCDSFISGGFLVKQRIPTMYRRIEVKEMNPCNQTGDDEHYPSKLRISIVPNADDSNYCQDQAYD